MDITTVCDAWSNFPMHNTANCCASDSFPRFLKLYKFVCICICIAVINLSFRHDFLTAVILDVTALIKNRMLPEDRFLIKLLTVENTEWKIGYW